MPTIYDVAKKAGCSPATVSKAYNNYAGVNRNTYERIMAAAEELGFTPNNTARTLATKKSWLIGVLFSEDRDVGIMHPHYSEILQRFRERGEELGYDMVFVSKRLGEKTISYLEHCKYRGVDGVLLAVSCADYEDIQCILESDIPCVSVEAIYDGHTTVISDNRMGAMQAMEYLYLLGHRRIAHIAGPLDTVAGKARAEAYREFLDSKGIPFNPKHYVEATDYSYEAAKEASVKLMQQSWDDKPTAVFVYYDDGAFATIATVAEYGHKVPSDISIVGFDNIFSDEKSET